MCTDCGCHSGEETMIHTHHSHAHSHSHVHSLLNASFASTHFRRIDLEQDILAKNNQYAQQNRNYFRQHHIFCLNLLSSPGSGKTSLLIKTLELLKNQQILAVIEGDQQTSQDADRIRETGVEAIQINTGKGCHLEAHGIAHAIESLITKDLTMLFIENVGNLVCPAAFDLGEAYKIVVLSITEGEDKPLKYPHIFQAADLLLINKIDLLPHLEFDLAKCIDYARQVNPRLKILCVSAKTGEGLAKWLQWLTASQLLATLG
ncbi:MAG: hypothetical protein RL637_1180 [Pseudomonadota bacterium]|jgi:hydrogenase nickel incorporation protein HypB